MTNHQDLRVAADEAVDRAYGTELVSDDELASRWRMSRTMIHALRRRGMPSLKIGRTRRYDPVACRRWLEDHQPELSEPAA